MSIPKSDLHPLPPEAPAPDAPAPERRFAQHRPTRQPAIAAAAPAPPTPLRPSDAPRPHGWREGSGPRLTLVVGAGDTATPDLDRALTDLARRAIGGDRAARDALYAALRPKIDRFVAHYRWAALAAGLPERNGDPWDLDDVAQEAFPAFVDLLADYGGERPFLPYFLAAFPWRLRDAWRRLQAPSRRVARTLAEVDLREDPSAVAEEARALLAALCADLAEPDATIVRLRVGEGISLPAIALLLGLSRTTVARRWERLRAWLREQLADDLGPGASDDRSPSTLSAAPSRPEREQATPDGRGRSRGGRGGGSPRP